jgi:transcriptional regulator with XRE-family HTH domain
MSRRDALAARRRALGLSQQDVADAVGVERSTIARYEQGKVTPRPWYRPMLAETLRVTLEQLADLIDGTTLTTTPAKTLGAMTDVEEDVMAMRAFRAADRQMGGAHLYASVRRYLHTEVAPRLVGGTGDGRPLHTGAAGLTEMAGWMAHDAGQDTAARQHFERALELSRVGGDSQLGAHILGSLSHLAHHLEHPDDAIRFARLGQDRLAEGPRHPGLAARLLAMQARGHAAKRHTDACTEALLTAERALDGHSDDEPSPWVSHFDEGSFASEAVRCMQALGDVGEARRQAERILELRPSSRTRSRAFGQLALVLTLIAEGHPDQACATAREVLDATQSLGSFVVVAQLRDLRSLLEPWRSNPTVKEFLECLEQNLSQRLWLARWLSIEPLT